MVLIQLILFVLLTALGFYSFADQACYDMIPQIEAGFENLQAVPGAIPSQIQIDKSARGLKRFFVNDGSVVLMDAERVPLVSKKRKTILPTQSLEGLYFEGVHLATRTHKPIHRGVEIFDMQLLYQNFEDSNVNESLESQGAAAEAFNLLSMFKDPLQAYYFQNFELQVNPFEVDRLEGPLWILIHQEDRSQLWSQHTFLHNAGIKLGKDTALSLFFETDFNNGAESLFMIDWMNNSLSGSRIDTCVYFMVRSAP